MPLSSLTRAPDEITGSPQMLAMKRGVSPGNHAYDNERLIGCAISV
jgi:hypothetical protein